MKYLHILFAITFFFLLNSCHNEPRKKKVNESTIDDSTSNKLNRRNTIDKPVDQKTKKQKLKALDSLRPISTLP